MHRGKNCLHSQGIEFSLKPYPHYRPTIPGKENEAKNKAAMIEPEESPVKVSSTKTKRRRISSSSEEESRNDAPVKREKSSENVQAEVEKMEVVKNPVKQEEVLSPKAKKKETSPKAKKETSPKAKKKETSPKVKKEATTPKVKKEESSPKTEEKKTIAKKDEQSDTNSPEKESLKDPEEKSPENEKPKPINPFARTVKIQNAGQGLAGADYDPSAKKYDPIKNAFWKRGDKYANPIDLSKSSLFMFLSLAGFPTWPLPVPSN